MTVPPVLRGRVVAVVEPGPGASTTVAALEASVLEDADLRVVVAGEGAAAGADAKNRAAIIDRIDYLAFVGPGTIVDPHHLQACLTILRSDLSVGLVGWSPSGMATGELDLCVAGQACVVRHTAFHAVGGFDAALGPVLHDIDLGWRMWLGGWRVRSIGPAPAAEVPVLPSEALAQVPQMLAGLLDRTSFDRQWDAPAAKLARRNAAGRRSLVQPGRRRGDGEIIPLVHQRITAWAAVEPSVQPLAELLGTLGAPDRAGSRRRIAVITADTLAARMAGPAMRAVRIATRLAADHDVVLATTTDDCQIDLPGVDVRRVGERGLRELERWCDVFLLQGWVLAGRPHLVRSDKVMVADLYDPMHLEQLEQARDAHGERGRYDAVRITANILNEQLERADFMLCASANQRDLWIGALAGLGRVNPVTYDRDESLRRLLAVVPFGVGDDPPVQVRSAIRDEIPGISRGDKVILWGGGVYNWFDPITLVRAVDRLRHRVPEVRLLFLGMTHPNPGVPKMRVAYETQQLAGELGLTDEHVFFNSEWVALDDRHNYLLDADVGVSTHLDHVETEFSFRTRILDYLWTGLPIVATDGDGFARLIEHEGLGVVVPPQDVDALAAALERVLTDEVFAETCRTNVHRVAERMRWERCLEPLVEFCRAPMRAADVACPDLDPNVSVGRLAHGRRRDLAIAVSYLRAGAPQIVVDRLRKRVRAAIR